MNITQNVITIKEKIAAAATQSGRRAEDIALIAATKMNDAARVREAIAAGVDGCGENRVQEFLEKDAQGAYEGTHKHFIGHLQKNKAKQIVGKVELIHGVDSLELLAVIDRVAEKLGLVQDVLLEINIGREESKSGFLPEELPEILDNTGNFAHIRIRGLMAIPPKCENGEENRQYFQQMQQLFVDISRKKGHNIEANILSMGMSGDFETAIACGANMVRIGSAIFGARIYPPKP